MIQINIDFAKLYPGKETGILEKWDIFKEIITPIFIEKIKDKQNQKTKIFL